MLLVQGKSVRVAVPSLSNLSLLSHTLRRTMSTTPIAAPPLSNVLAYARSPYLLQHKDNPVAWQEFTPETIKLAQRLGRPIFLSSGYSACHWCHVLAHESFEDETTANLLNEYFINIKLDREERPDVDRLYMTYLQATQGGGGWPLSVFMTPNLEPFFAGTYFPNSQFKTLISRVHELWDTDRERCEQMGKSVIETLSDVGESSRTPSSLANLLSTKPWDKIFAHLLTTHDPRHGGFSPSGTQSTGPKFPSCSLTLEPLARLATYAPHKSDSSTEITDERDRREVARGLAIGMISGIWKGGIHDWVGGGVARYSVDEKWIVPHFEKMLYDQAQLASNAIDFALISDPLAFEGEDKVAVERDRKLCFDLAADILEYSLKDLLSPEGAFWSAEDADSAPAPEQKKTEGAFYVWTKIELDEILGQDAKIAEHFFGVERDGNVSLQHDAHGELRGKNILFQAHTAAETAIAFSLTTSAVEEKIHRACIALRQERNATRERPGLDDKILTSWNGLMLTALAKASVSLPKDQYPVAARCASVAHGVVEFIRSQMWDKSNKTLSRSWRQGKGTLAQTDDYAFLIKGLLDLYEATGEESYAVFAIELQDRQDELFWDEAMGGYFASAPDEHVLIRMKDSQDAAEPSATSISVHNLSRLSLIAANDYEKYENRAEKTYVSIGVELERFPRAFATSVCGLMDLEQGYREFVVTGPEGDRGVQDILNTIHKNYIPNKVIIRIDHARPPLELAKRNGVIKALVESPVGESSLRVCENGACGLPITNLSEAEEAVRGKD